MTQEHGTILALWKMAQITARHAHTTLTNTTEKNGSIPWHCNAGKSKNARSDLALAKAQPLRI